MSPFALATQGLTVVSFPVFSKTLRHNISLKKVSFQVRMKNFCLSLFATVKICDKNCFCKIVDNA